MFNNDPNVINVGDCLLVKEEVAFSSLMATFQKHGYVLENHSKYPQYPGVWHASCLGKTPPQGWKDYHIVVQMWHRPRLEPSPKLHVCIIEGVNMVADCGWYINDGKTMFFPEILEEMRGFVEHFTTLDLPKWDAMIARAPKTGPGMVRAIAHFCHPQAIVKNTPSICNVLVASGKMAEGSNLTAGEMLSALHSLADPGVRCEFDELVDALGPPEAHQ